MQKFKLISDFLPTGDQPQAIQKLVSGVNAKMRHQVLLGVTGSGKTFTIANVIEKLQRPTLVISHNKTLAAQLYQEFKSFFPEDAVCYFVSYYDYYQPEAYIPQTDTYIEKDADINEEIDKLRLAATSALLSRPDVIVVASVSCIYNLGSPQEYGRMTLNLAQGEKISRENLQRKLISLFYQRNDFDFRHGSFRVRGETIDIWPAYLDYAYRIELPGNVIQNISVFEPVSGKQLDGQTVRRLDKEKTDKPTNRPTDQLILFPAKHYITPEDQRTAAIRQIRKDLFARIRELKNQGQQLEAYRLSQKTNYDLELIEEIGYCKGIENYSRYFDGRAPGEPPYTLLDFFNLNNTEGLKDREAEKIRNWLLVVDESHMTIPQIQGMYKGDRSRKETLIDYGFRLPSALDNRPLRFEEFLESIPETIYTSATPGPWEEKEAILSSRKTHRHKGIVEQLIRPTGLLDPKIEIRGSKNQIDNLIKEIITRVMQKERILVTTLTKRTAEELSNFL
ncbi:MAG: DEAD/DEAH box helicase family protein, partial [Candidatus Cloacimonetes bacterium]|nr:DEAD/DEAH box helicase family protein [Candidatus Cloacimonadota bacterium]